MKTIPFTLIFVGVLALTLVGTAHAATINIAFHKENTTASSMNTRSADSVVNTGVETWNHVVGTTLRQEFTGFALSDASGTAAVASLGVDSGFIDSTGVSVATDKNQGFAMMDGAYFINSTESVTVSGLSTDFTSVGYSVVIFADWANRKMDFTLSGTTKTIPVNGLFDGDFIEGEDYVVFTGLTSSSFSISGNVSGRSAINGMIITTGVYEPPEPNPNPNPEINSFQAVPRNRVPAGTDVTLTWAATNFTSLVLNPGGIDVSAATSMVVTASTSTPYTLTAVNADGVADSRTLTVTVGSQPFPNILVFFLDDFGWADWEQNGADTGSIFHETPNMNRLAREGIYFDNGYASAPVCSPTRGSLLSGQSPAYSKLTDWISGAGDAGKPIRQAEWVKKLEISNSIFPEVLAQYGYRAIHIGKWHLGAGTSPESNPINHGFQINIGGNQYGTPPGPESYFASAAGFSNLPNLGSDVAPAGSYLTDVLTEQAVEQIRMAASEETPFVLYLAHYAVHTPIQAPAATVQKYQDKLDNNPGMDWQGHVSPTYAAMVEHVDRSLGEILAALEDPDGNPLTDDSIATNTLVVFTADNGGLTSVTSNRPLRDGKGGDYEAGVRLPWVFWWPGTIDPGTNSEPIISHDLYPTVLSVAGLDVPQGHVVNGQDLTPLLTGGVFERQSPLVFHYPHWSPQGGTPHSAVRKGDWKLVYKYPTASWELYNLKDDIGETNNLIGSQTNVHAVLSWLMAEGLEQLDANYPRNTSTLAEEPPVPLVRDDVHSDSDKRSDF
jgi:arylsulfatase A-like enzyme